MKVRRVTKSITFHHSGDGPWDMEDTPKGKLLALEKSHRARDFVMTGYNHVGVPDYAAETVTWYNARPEELQGAHSRGENWESLGVMVFGNFTEAKMPPWLYLSVVRFLTSRANRWELSNYDVYGHREREGANTECPGLTLDLDKLRRDIGQEMILLDTLARTAVV